MKTCPKYTDIFKTVKFEIFHLKNFDVCITYGQKIDCGYTLDPLGEAVLTSIHNLYVLDQRKDKRGVFSR